MSQKNDLFRAAYDALRDKDRVVALFEYIETKLYPSVDNPYKTYGLSIAELYRIESSFKFKVYFLLCSLKKTFGS
jgi:hypothetical protein